MRHTAIPACLALALFAQYALAQSSPSQPGAAPESRQSVPGGQTGVKPEEQAATGLWDRSNLFGTLGGLRPALAGRGVTFGLTETSEVFGNPAGGVRQAAIYEGVTSFGVGLDLEKLAGLPGGVLNVTGYQVHGRGLSFNALGNDLNTVSSLEAPRGTYLFELWYEQQLFDKALAVRVGQLAADQEFMVSQYAGLFLNHTFGWSTLPSTDLPTSGPSYPFATPGVRVRYAPREDVSLLLGVFNGDPAGSPTPGQPLPQQRNPSGTAFRLGDGVFAIVEVRYGINGSPDAKGLPGTYKLGAYYDSQPFTDLRHTASGESLAGLPATATGKARRNNLGFYGVADQLLFREPGTKDQGLGAFVRVMGAPGDRNLVNFYLDAGLTYKGLVPGRDGDTLGLAVGFARVSDTASKLDSDIALSQGGGYPVRRHETVLELTYQAQVAPWLQVQPTAQYVFNPLGGVPDPANPAHRLRDALVLGLRAGVTF